MRSIFDMKGPEKAAALLMLLGPQITADILKHLDETSVERLTAEMIKMKSLPESEREELIGDFMIELKKSARTSSGGINRARKIIEESFGEEKADEMIKKIESKDVESAFKFLSELTADEILALVKDEPAQMISLVLSFMPPKTSGEILKKLPRDKAREAGLKLARMKNVSPEAAVAVARALRKRYRTMKSAEEDESHAGGISSLVSILGHMSSDSEKKILDSLGITMPQVAEEISERIFSFENIASLSNAEMRLLIDELNDDYLIAFALKGAEDEIRFRFLRNMSQNRATDIIEEMNRMGAVKLKEVLEYREAIIEAVRHMEARGAIRLRKSGEEWVE
ncbi:MAG TPA: flagellar motor switch protein FliG [Spirochaetota bacterium]|mgnify:CR=1 FL=1|nr:flagellar motor switch protein FliG [Spirochaetota bacterium]